MRKISLLLVIFAFSSVSAFAQNPLGEILKRMKAHRQALTSLSADMTINKFIAQFGGTYTKESSVKFVPRADEYFIRIDSIKPAPEAFLFVKNEYLLYLPDVKTAYAGTITDAQKDMLTIFSILTVEGAKDKKDKLKEGYTIIYVGQEKVDGTTPTWHIKLKPETVKNIRLIELWVDGNGMPIQSKIVENNDDWTSILFRNLKKNANIAVADFQIKLPKETKLNKN